MRLLLPAAIALWGKPGKVWTILALGDSITAGGEAFHSYRGPLARMIRKSGFAVRWVGSRTTSSDEPALAQDGYPGKPVEFLAANMERIYSAHPADIILLHAGHNHAAQENPIPGIVASTREIVAITRRINPCVVILLAQVIPSGKLPKYAYIPELNVQLASLALELSSKNSPVILVNQAKGFDVSADTIGDRVHPNEKGAVKMAHAWFDALLPILAAGSIPFGEASFRKHWLGVLI